MKQLFNIIGIAVITATSQISCSTNAVTTTSKVEAVTITSVDTAMNVWGDWVRAGKATQSQVDAVKKAYNHYYDAQQVMKATLEMATVQNGTNSLATDIITANSAVANASQTIINLITSFTK